MSIPRIPQGWRLLAIESISECVRFTGMSLYWYKKIRRDWMSIDESYQGEFNDLLFEQFRAFSSLK